MVRQEDALAFPDILNLTPTLQRVYPQYFYKGIL